MTTTWANIEHLKNTEAYKLHRIKKQNPNYAYEEAILSIAEENTFLAARIVGFLDTFNTDLKAKIFDIAVQVVKNSRKGEKFVWAVHVFEFYQKLDKLAVLLELNNNQMSTMNLMQEQGNDKALEYFYSILIDNAQDWDTSYLFYQAFLSREAVVITGVIFSNLINKSPNFEMALHFFREMQRFEIQPNEIVYSTLINKSQTFEQAKFFFEEMKSKNLVPNEISYSTLINKAQTFEQQKPFYQEFIKKFPLRKGNFKSKKNYNYLFFALFKKVRNKTDWDFVKSQIDTLGVTLDEKYHTRTRLFYKELREKYG